MSEKFETIQVFQPILKTRPATSVDDTGLKLLENPEQNRLFSGEQGKQPGSVSYSLKLVISPLYFVLCKLSKNLELK